MTRHLLAQKDEPFDDYTCANFESELGRHFEVAEREPLPSGTRTLYFARPGFART